jgi:hypothetical protein
MSAQMMLCSDNWAKCTKMSDVQPLFQALLYMYILHAHYYTLKAWHQCGLVWPARPTPPLLLNMLWFIVEGEGSSNSC